MIRKYWWLVVFAVFVFLFDTGDDGRIVFLRKIQAHAGPSLLLRRSAQRPADHVFDGKILKINALERRRSLRLRIAEATVRSRDKIFTKP